MSHHVDPAAIAEEARTVWLDAVLGPPRRSVPVGDSSTPESRTLTPLIMVRIQVPQPYNQVILPHFVSFRLRRNLSDMSAGYAPSITMVRFQRRKTAA